MDQETRILEPIPAEDEIRITATPWLDEVEARRASTLDCPRDRGRRRSTASGSTPPASATSSRCPRTPTGRSASSKYDHYGRRSAELGRGPRPSRPAPRCVANR